MAMCLGWKESKQRLVHIHSANTSCIIYTRQGINLLSGTGSIQNPPAWRVQVYRSHQYRKCDIRHVQRGQKGLTAHAAALSAPRHLEVAMQRGWEVRLALACIVGILGRAGGSSWVGEEMGWPQGGIEPSGGFHHQILSQAEARAAQNGAAWITTGKIADGESFP